MAVARAEPDERNHRGGDGGSGWKTEMGRHAYGPQLTILDVCAFRCCHLSPLLWFGRPSVFCCSAASWYVVA
jgi:hypothetical protein